MAQPPILGAAGKSPARWAIAGAADNPGRRVPSRLRAAGWFAGRGGLVCRARRAGLPGAAGWFAGRSGLVCRARRAGLPGGPGWCAGM
jgi:hypothetical protein